MATLQRALEIALKEHAGQVDKGGHPYILHPLAVLHRVMEWPHTHDDHYMIAVLHDVVEDTTTELDDLRIWGFSERVVVGVDAMSRREGESNRIYYARVMANRDATFVKMADLEHNMDPDRVPPEMRPDDFEVQLKWRRNLHECLLRCVETGVPYWPDKNGNVKSRPDLVQVAEEASCQTNGR